jgi:hypothetical protein
MEGTPFSPLYQISFFFATLPEKHPAAADLLCLCAFLAPDAIPEEVLTAGEPSLGPVLAAVAADPFQFNEAIRSLRAYSLIQRSAVEQTLSMHRLVQAVFQGRLSEAERRTWAERAVCAVNAAFPNVESDGMHEMWPRCERLLTQALFVAQRIKQYHIVNVHAGRLLFQLGIYLRERGRYVEAEPLFLLTTVYNWLIHFFGEAFEK